MSTAKLLVARLRELADLLDAHPELEKFPEIFDADDVFGKHEFGDQAAQLDVFAETFGVKINHRVHRPRDGKPGARYSDVGAFVDGRHLFLQAYTEDYEKATGKTVPVPLTPELLAEAKHWAENPLPRDIAAATTNTTPQGEPS